MTTADATKRDLSTMLRPRSIALVGATDRSSWSRNTFDNLTKRSYAGEVHLVARRGGTVHGRAAATSCVALGQQVDLGLLMVPMAATEEAMADLAASGARNAVILTSGFAETGHGGAAEQDKLAEMARRHGISVLGPNCLGFVNFLDDVPLWTGAFRAPSRTGPIAIISQSGATASFIASLAHQQDIGLSHMISTGNEADLDSAAFVDHLLDDERVRAIVMFTETIRDAHRFAAAAQRARAAAKPIIVLKIGLSDVTARSAQAHTGALVGDNRVFDGVCKQFGVVRVNSVEDLLFTADVIARTGVLKPKGLGIVSVSGGACEIAADRAQLEGVSLPPLSDDAAQALTEMLPSFGTAHNPLDITGGAVLEPELFEKALRIMTSQPEYAALACLFDVPVSEEQATEFYMNSLRHIAAGLKDPPIPAFVLSHTLKPVTDTGRRIIAELGLPYVSGGIAHGVTALGHAWWWSEQQRRGAQPWSPAATREPVRAAAHRARGTRPSGAPRRADRAGHLGDRRSLRRRGGARARRAGGAEDRQRGHPAQERHRRRGAQCRWRRGGGGGVPSRDGSGAGGGEGRRRAGLADARARARTVRRLRARRAMGAGACGRARRHLRRGACRMSRCACCRFLPRRSRRMLGELKGSKLLDGQRGIPAADLDAVAAAIARIGDAVVALGPALQEFDVNPLWVRGPRVEALDALAVWRD